MGFNEFFGKTLRDKKLQKAALEVASSCASTSPVIKIVQAAHYIVKVGNTVQNADDLVSVANDAAKSAQAILPQMHIMGQSLVDSARLLSQFSLVATTLGMGANVIQTYQGVQALNLIATKLSDISNSLEAQAAPTAQRDFPQYVYDMVRERLSQTSTDSDRDHWFFLYHPDTDWYPKFFHLVDGKPLNPRFCAYTNQLDTVFTFMLAARERIQLHLIIPAYQSILIPERIQIPEEIGDFVIEGRINSNRLFVWPNLPEEQKCYTFDIGLWTPPPPGIWDIAMEWFGISEKPHRNQQPLGSWE
ncbi:hypothetical protein FOBRF1_014699 [Fusarium oxysporum]